MPAPYPRWKYYPPRARPPDWAAAVVAAFTQAQPQLDSALRLGMNSNAALAELRPALVALGFEIEAGKKRAERIRRPVLWRRGRGGSRLRGGWVPPRARNRARGRGGSRRFGNAIYRDLIQTSLLIDARYLVLAVLNEYHYRSGGKPMMSPNYRIGRSILDAIYASNRLTLPLDGVLLVGY